MRALVLWADDCSPNLGVRVLAQGTGALLTRAFPGVQLESYNFSSPRPVLPAERLRSLVRERVTGAGGMQRWFRSFDLIVDTRSGDSFADIYGMRRHRIMSAVFEFATQSGTPVVLGPQTIGPFGSREGTWLGRRTLKRARAVMARDSESARCSEQLGRPVDVVTTDVTFALPVPRVRRDRDVVLNVSGLLWHPNPHLDAARYRETVSEVYRSLVNRGRRVSVLAHVIGTEGNDADVSVAKQFIREVAPGAELVIPGSLDHVRDVLASSEVLVASRMHACLNALSVGTPAIALAYSRKFKPLFDGIGWGATVELRQPGAAAAAVRLVEDAANLHPEAERVARRARASLDGAVEILRGAAR